MNHPERPGRAGNMIMFVATVATATLVAACGGSYAEHTHRSAQTGSAIEFARCMRASGVPGFPDSGAEIQSLQGSQTISINGVSISVGSPAFQAALHKCDHYISGSAPITAAEQAKFARETLKVARCMRAHGVPDYPDSGTWTGPNPNPQSPAFKTAAEQCGVGVANGVSLP